MNYSVPENTRNFIFNYYNWLLYSVKQKTSPQNRTNPEGKLHMHADNDQQQSKRPNANTHLPYAIWGGTGGDGRSTDGDQVQRPEARIPRKTRVVCSSRDRGGKRRRGARYWNSVIDLIFDWDFNWKTTFVFSWCSSAMYLMIFFNFLIHLYFKKIVSFSFNKKKSIFLHFQ